MASWRRSQPRGRGSLRGFAAAASGLLLLLSPSSGRADDVALWGWLPSLGIASSFVSVGGSGQITSSVRPSATGDEDVQFAIYGVSLGLASPPIAPLPFAPRVAGLIGLSSGIRAGQDLAREGAPGKLEQPVGVPGLPEAGVTGQGSNLNAGFGSYFLNGNLGMSFELELLDRRLSVTPSFEWAIYQMRLAGAVRRAFRQTTTPLANTRFVAMDALGRKVLRGIGPGLEVELEAARFGPLVSSVAVSGQAYRLFGDRDRVFVASFSDGAGNESATWRAKFHRWTYRGGLGVRLYWRPE